MQHRVATDAIILVIFSLNIYGGNIKERGETLTKHHLVQMLCSADALFCQGLPTQFLPA
jgi:hypothetical protein